MRSARLVAPLAQLHHSLPCTCIARLCSPTDGPRAAQEVLSAPTQYSGKAADVWAVGVHLYIMLVGWYPFTDPRHPHDFSRTANNIIRGRFAFPTKIAISEECKELITRMLHRDPERRITIPQIQAHPWYRKNLSREIAVRRC